MLPLWHLIVVLLPALYAYRQGKTCTIDYNLSPTKPSPTTLPLYAPLVPAQGLRKPFGPLMPELRSAATSGCGWGGFRLPGPLGGDRVRNGEETGGYRTWNWRGCHENWCRSPSTSSGRIARPDEAGSQSTTASGCGRTQHGLVCFSMGKRDWKRG